VSWLTGNSAIEQVIPLVPQTRTLSEHWKPFDPMDTTSYSNVHVTTSGSSLHTFACLYVII
jgi:hypothetical protein